jgi:hypothetical protein
VSDLEELRRWEDFGGTWKLVARRGGLRVLSLLRCDGGEEVHRLSSVESDLRDYVDSRCDDRPR